MNKNCPNCMVHLLDNYADGGGLVPYDETEPRSVLFCSDDCRDEYKEEECQ